MKRITFLIIASTLTFTTVNAQTSNVANTESTQQQETSTLVLKVSGANCNNDLRTLAQRVKAVDGVYNCETVGKRGVNTKFKVDFNPGLISEKEIRTAFESTPGCSDPNEFPYKVK